MRGIVFDDQKRACKDRREDAIKRVKFPWGELIIVGATDEVSVGVDVIFPSKETDGEGAYLKEGIAIYYVIKGKGSCGGKSVKKGDLFKITPGQKVNIRNDSKNDLRVMTIYIPPYDEANIGCHSS